MRLCFLGCGWAAGLHSRTTRGLRPAVRCSYASRTPEKARALNAKHDGAGAFGSYDEALRSDAVDVVMVLTPPVSHLEWTLAALGAGKDVILEKPPVLRSSDFDAIVQACRDTGRLVYVAENYYYKPLLAKVRETLQSGAIGEPLFIHLNAVKRQRTGNWRDDEATAGGGALYEGGIHWVNFAGSLGYEIRAVRAARPGAHAGLERSMALLLEYAEGPVGLLSYSWEVASPLKGLRISRIYGREGSIAFESNGLFVASSGGRWGVYFPGLHDIQGYKGMFADFLRAWRARTEPRMTLARARHDLEVVEAAYRCTGVTL
jgi:predicted dehydrogenase